MKKVFAVFCLIIGISLIVLDSILICKINNLQISLDAHDKSQSLLAEELFIHLDELKTMTNDSFEKTTNLNKTYKSLLRARDKKTVDTVSSDTAVSVLINEADALYRQKKYAESYIKYKNVLSYHPENLQVRTKKVISQYYMNPMDSSNYAEILSDIKNLNKNGINDRVLNEIKTAVSSELGN